MNKYSFSADQVFNFAEIGITTVVRSPKVIAEKGKKQVDQIVSVERNVFVAFCAIINATGNTIPPAFVFSRIRYNDHFLKDGMEC